jgi:SAM-dependent methyltransferase
MSSDFSAGVVQYSEDLFMKDGIFYSRRQSQISYPEDGNALCMEFEDKSFWFKHRNRCIASLVTRYSNNALFWDVGGGNGYVAKGLQDHGIESVLLEPGECGAANARSRGLNHVVCSSLENAGIKNESMAAVGLFDVLEHIEEDQLFLRRLHSLIKDLGLLYITVPAYKQLWSEEDDRAGHFRRYTLKELKKQLRDQGYTVIYASYFFSFLPLPILLFRTFPSLLARWKSKSTRKKSGSMQKAKREHTSPRLSSFILNRLLNFELNRIADLKVLPFGASCIIVAQKRSGKRAE